MTLRLSDELAAALRELAAREGRSVHEVAVMAVEAWVAADRRSRHVDAMFDDVAAEDADLVDRLSR